MWKSFFLEKKMCRYINGKTRYCCEQNNFQLKNEKEWQTKIVEKK